MHEYVEADAENPLEFGTRAKGTDSLLYRVLQSEYRTEEVIVRFLDAAITPRQPQDMIRKRARKLLATMARWGESAIPTTTLDLVSWSELSEGEKDQSLEAFLLPDAKRQRKSRRTTRHFKPCKQCGVRFLAKRSDQEFHSPKCRVRWSRSHPTVTGNCPGPSESRINIGENEAVFAMPSVLD
jgi:hypothetical protein